MILKKNQPPRERAGSLLIDEMNRTKTPFGMVAVWFLGQESVVIKGGDTILYIDPYVSGGEGTSSRAFPPPISPEDIVHASAVLITHEHEDHLDLDTVSVVAKLNPDTIFSAPACCHPQMQRVGLPANRLYPAKCDEWQDFDGYRLKAVPAAHEQLEEEAGKGHRYVGYLIDINGVMIYHAGDTVVYPGLVDRLKEQAIDIGMVPINGADAFRRKKGIVGNMGFREAAELAYEAAFDLTIPMHYDLFAFNGERPGYFIDYCYENYPYMKCKVMARTERFIYVKD